MGKKFPGRERQYAGGADSVLRFVQSADAILHAF